MVVDKDIDLQDGAFWKRFFTELRNWAVSPTYAALYTAAHLPVPTTLLPESYIPALPCRDLQDSQGGRNFDPFFGDTYKTGTPPALTNPSWNHYDVVDLWRHSLVLSRTDIRGHNGDVRTTVGSTADKYRNFNWSQLEVRRIRHIAGRDAIPYDASATPFVALGVPNPNYAGFLGEGSMLAVRSPRLIGATTNRFWFCSCEDTLDRAATAIPAARRFPAVAGMRAVMVSGSSYALGGSVGNYFRLWTQSPDVYEYNGKRWIALPEVHGKSVFPDVLRSDAANPNYKYHAGSYNSLLPNYSINAPIFAANYESQAYFGHWAYSGL